AVRDGGVDGAAQVHREGLIGFVLRVPVHRDVDGLGRVTRQEAERPGGRGEVTVGDRGRSICRGEVDAGRERGRARLRDRERERRAAYVALLRRANVAYREGCRTVVIHDGLRRAWGVDYDARGGVGVR